VNNLSLPGNANAFPWVEWGVQEFKKRRAI
jgi:hypothetical protein